MNINFYVKRGLLRIQHPKLTRGVICFRALTLAPVFAISSPLICFFSSLLLLVFNNIFYPFFMLVHYLVSKTLSWYGKQAKSCHQGVSKKWWLNVILSCEKSRENLQIIIVFSFHPSSYCLLILRLGKC